MKRLFVYTSLFQRRLNALQNSEMKAREIENMVLNQPDAGDMVPGTGGVRKLRVADEARGKGRRGGIRVLFLDLPHAEVTYLLFLFTKNESADISFVEKKAIRELVFKLKKEKS